MTIKKEFITQYFAHTTHHKAIEKNTGASQPHKGRTRASRTEVSQRQNATTDESAGSCIP
jgi:hypothetical protein